MIPSQEASFKERHVDKKVDKAKRDQALRVAKLEEQELSNVQCAQLIEHHLREVDEALAIMRSGVEAGMDWTALENLVKQERRSGNHIAGIIHSLQLEQNQITLMLTPEAVPVAGAAQGGAVEGEEEGHDDDDRDDDDHDSDSDGDDDPERESRKGGLSAGRGGRDDLAAVETVKLVEVDLALSAYANAGRYYSTMKKVKDKKEKTLAVADAAISRAGKSAVRSAGETRAKITIQTIRKVHWWEKFNWFISTDGHVVIAGRDAQQNELLVKRYLRPGDAYVHAEVHGAASCIVKGKPGLEGIPVDTLAQAGMMTMCRSNAWMHKVPVSAWWVEPEQVSKTAPAGEYLTTGSFMIRGKKNPLPSGSLAMGLAVLFRVTPESAKNHEDDWTRGSGVDASDSEFMEQASGSEDQGGFGSDDDGGASDRGDRFAGSDADDDDGNADSDAGPGKRELRSAVATGDRGNTDTNDIHGDDGSSDDAALDGGSAASAMVDPRFQLQVSAETTAFADDTSADAAGDAGSKKAGLSIAERRRLKKAQKRGGAPAPEEPAKKKEEKGPAPAPKVRGKHGKQKKIETKYRHQTPEERAQMERLLHEPSKRKVEEPQLGRYTNAKADAVMAEGLAELLQADKEAQDTSATRAQRRAAEKQEVAAIVAEEQIDDAPLREGDDELRTLTGQPHADDAFQYAMLVCAPWTALGAFKYKLKVVPGAAAGKKSRVANEALQLFLKHPEATERELELLKALSVDEAAALLPPSARLVLPGALSKKKATGVKHKGGKRRGANKRSARRGK